MAATLEKLIEEIKNLSPEEQQRLRDTLAEVIPSAADTNASSAEGEAKAEEEFKRRLLEAGLIKEIKRPPRDLQKAHEEFLKYQPIRIQGKPISETIIEERR